MTAAGHVIVTGAAGGIGRAVVELLLARDQIAVTAVDLDPVELPVDPNRLLTVAADVSARAQVEAAVQQAVDRWGRLDGIANVAGISGPPVGILDTDDEAYDRVMAVNARSAWLTMQAVLPHLIAAGGGAVVNTGSRYAQRGGPAFAAYAASKHAVVGMTKVVAWDFAQHNIRANVVSPGPTETPMIRAAFEAAGSNGEAKVTSQLPSGRLATPTEVGEVIVWALLDAPMQMSGQTIAVDAGANS